MILQKNNSIKLKSKIITKHTQTRRQLIKISAINSQY